MLVWTFGIRKHWAAEDSCKQELYKITPFCIFTDAYEFQLEVHKFFTFPFP